MVEPTTGAVLLVGVLFVPMIIRSMLGLSSAFVFGSHVIGCIALAVLFYTTGLLSLWFAILFAITPIATKMTAKLHWYRLGRKALNGDYGSEKKWIAEMIRDDDQQFVQAWVQLDYDDAQEIVIVAESKPDLRERVIERANE